MSHTVKVNVIANQEITLCGDVVNIYNIQSIFLDENGMIDSYAIIPHEDNLTKEIIMEKERTVPASNFVDTLAANINNKGLTDKEFRTFISG